MKKSDDIISYTANDIQSDPGINDGYVEELDKQAAEANRVTLSGEQKSQGAKDPSKRKRKQGKQLHHKSSNENDLKLHLKIQNQSFLPF